MQYRPLPPPSTREEYRAHKLAALHELTEMGVDLARRTHAQAIPTAAEEPAPTQAAPTQAAPTQAAPTQAAPAAAKAAPAATPKAKTSTFDQITITIDRTARRTIALADYLGSKPLEAEAPPAPRRTPPPRNVRSATNAMKRRRATHEGPSRYTPPVERLEPAIEDDLGKLSDEELTELLQHELAAQARYTCKHTPEKPGPKAAAAKTAPTSASHAAPPTKPKSRIQHEQPHLPTAARHQAVAAQRRVGQRQANVKESSRKPCR